MIKSETFLLRRAEFSCGYLNDATGNSNSNSELQFAGKVVNVAGNSEKFVEGCETEAYNV